MRHNPLGGSAPTTAARRRLSRVTTPAGGEPADNPLFRTIIALSLETFACLLQTTDLHECETTRTAFAGWCAASGRKRDWRAAWRAWRGAPGKPRIQRSAMEKALAALRRL